jgi:hypothetical protein
MLRKLLGIISVGSDITGQLLIIYSEILDKWEYSEAMHLLFLDSESLWFSYEGGFSLAFM